MNNQQKAILRKAMQILGSQSTPAKAAAARRNGKLGGRPRKTNKRGER